MATHSSILAWRIPGKGEPGGLPSMGSHSVGHNWSDLAAAAAAAKWRWPHKKIWFICLVTERHSCRECSLMCISVGKKNVFILCIYFKSFQPFSRVWLFATLWTAAHQASLSIINSGSLFKLMSIVSVMLSNHLILCCPLSPLPCVFPIIRVFSNESVLRIRWPKYCSFIFSISPSSEYSELISFWMDWLDLLAVPGTLKSLLQQFKSISSLVLSFLYSPTLTSIHDCWKNHSFD